LFPDDPIIDVVFGLICAGLVVDSLHTGRVGLPRIGVLQKQKAPRAFWVINLMHGALAAYLIYSGAVALLPRHPARVTVIWHGEPNSRSSPPG